MRRFVEPDLRRAYAGFHDAYLLKVVCDYEARRVELFLDDLHAGLETTLVRPGALVFEGVEWSFCQLPFVGGAIRIEGMTVSGSDAGVVTTFELTTTEWTASEDFAVIRLEITARDIWVVQGDASVVQSGGPPREVERRIRTEGESAPLLAELLENLRSILGGSGMHMAVHSARHPMPVCEDDVFAVWRQVTWELVVERPLAEQRPGLVLMAYDGHADWWEESLSVRVLDANAVATHEVRFRVVDGARELVDGGERDARDYPFNGFVDVSSGWPERSGRHLHAALFENNGMWAFELADVVFFLAPVATARDRHGMRPG